MLELTFEIDHVKYIKNRDMLAEAITKIIELMNYKVVKVYFRWIE